MDKKVEYKSSYGYVLGLLVIESATLLVEQLKKCHKEYYDRLVEQLENGEAVDGQELDAYWLSHKDLTDITDQYNHSGGSAAEVRWAVVQLIGGYEIELKNTYQEDIDSDDRFNELFPVELFPAGYTTIINRGSPSESDFHNIDTFDTREEAEESLSNALDEYHGPHAWEHVSDGQWTFKGGFAGGYVAGRIHYEEPKK